MRRPIDTPHAREVSSSPILWKNHHQTTSQTERAPTHVAPKHAARGTAMAAPPHAANDPARSEEIGQLGAGVAASYSATAVSSRRASACRAAARVDLHGAPGQVQRPHHKMRPPVHHRNGPKVVGVTRASRTAMLAPRRSSSRKRRKPAKVSPHGFRVIKPITRSNRGARSRREGRAEHQTEVRSELEMRAGDDRVSITSAAATHIARDGLSLVGVTSMRPVG